MDMGNQSTQIKMGNQTIKLDLGKIEIEAMQSIELKVGQSSIKIDQMGVTIKGMMIKVEAQIQAQVQALMTQVNGDAMTAVQGRHRDDQLDMGEHTGSDQYANRHDRRGGGTRRGGDGAAAPRTASAGLRGAAHGEGPVPRRRQVPRARAAQARSRVVGLGLRAALGAARNPRPRSKPPWTPPRNGSPSPTTENRRAAMAAAQKAELDTAAGCAGLGAFFSGGSLAPPDAHPVPPGEFLTAKAVSGAVIFAAVAKQPEKAPEKFRSFVAQGVEVANRIKLWEPRS